jgi:hypothetical protein
MLGVGARNDTEADVRSVAVFGARVHSESRAVLPAMPRAGGRSVHVNGGPSVRRAPTLPTPCARPGQSFYCRILHDALECKGVRVKQLALRGGILRPSWSTASTRSPSRQDPPRRCKLRSLALAGGPERTYNQATLVSGKDWRLCHLPSDRLGDRQRRGNGSGARLCDHA